MGEWFQTCAISQLPIRPQEDALLLFLVRSLDETRMPGRMSASHALWTPWSLPIPGIYDGYGRLEVPITWRVKLVLDRIRASVLERGVGPNEEHHPAVDLADLDGYETFTHLQELVTRDRVLVQPGLTPEHVPLSMCFIRAEVYEALAAAPAFGPESIHQLDAAIETELRKVDDVVESPIHSGALDDAIESFKSTPFGQTIDKTLAALGRYRQVAEAAGSYGPPGYRGIGVYGYFAVEQVMSGRPKDHPTVVECLTELGTFKHVILHMEWARKLWQPQTGRGAARTGWASHAALARTVLNVAMREFEAETEQYEDPDPVVEG